MTSGRTTTVPDQPPPDSTPRQSALLAVSVVVPTYQRRDSVCRLLDALALQDMDPRSYEVVVAVDGSTDGTAELLRSLHAPFLTHVVEQPNRGRAAACNLGISRASAALIVLLDDDMQPARGMLRGHLRAHDGAAPRVAVGPVPIVIPPDASPIVHYRAAVFEAKAARLSQPGYIPRIGDVYMGNVSFPRDLFRAAGGFNEKFRVYGHEDFELLRRMMQAGGSLVFASDATALQHYEKGLVELARDVRAEGETAVLFATLTPSAFHDLELGTWEQRSGRHRAVLTRLLRAGVRWAGVTTAIIRTTALVERRRPRFLKRWYDLAFDYLYWLGVVQAPGPVGTAFGAGMPMTEALRQLIGPADSAEREISGTPADR
jgi:glycosyltransferase involved in cell wall biosynthesis